MTKIGSVKPAKAPEMTIYYDEKEKYNRYKVYIEWWSAPGPTHHRKLVNKFADLGSCVCTMKDYIIQHNEESR